MLLGNVGSCRLVDYFNVAPVGSLSDPQRRLSMGLAACVWGQRGHFWLEQALTAGSSVHFLTSGAGMSTQFTHNLCGSLRASAALDRCPPARSGRRP